MIFVLQLNHSRFPCAAKGLFSFYHPHILPRSLKSITILQQRGLGYKRISGITLLPVNTVKAYVSCHPVERADVCLQCGASLSQSKHRREKKFCSGECKTRWWNAHPHMMKRTAAHSFVCPVCGREFQDYGKRKYCSVKCYAEARRKDNG